MVEVTEADRLALREYLAERARRSFAGRIEPHADLLLETLARHRIAAENAALERAAKVADDYVTYHDKHDDGLSGFDKMSLGASEVAEEIRAMKGPSNA